MKTWAILAAKHAALPSVVGFSMVKVIGSASVDSFALGVTLAALGFAAFNSSRQSTGGLIVASEPRERRLTRMKQRVDVLLAEMLGDDADEAPTARPASAAEIGSVCVAGADEDFWGPDVSSDAASASGYGSRHRLAGSAGTTRERRRSDSQRSGPRHAAPPASFRLTNRSAAHAGR